MKLITISKKHKRYIGIGAIVFIFIVLLASGSIMRLITGTVNFTQGTKDKIAEFNSLFKDTSGAVVSQHQNEAEIIPESSDDIDDETLSSTGNTPVNIASLYPTDNTSALQEESATSKVDSQQKKDHQGLDVHFIDVGNADAILISCDGEYTLIDAGESIVGEKVVDYLMKQEVDRLKYVVATHPHSDHIGGIPDVLNAFTVDAILLSPAIHTSQAYTDMLKTIEKKNIDAYIPQIADTYPLGKAQLTVYGPEKDWGNNLNNASLVIRLVYGTSSFLFTGDMESDAEAALIKNTKMIKSNVIKIGHHGSSTSTSKDFINKVKPEYAVISCGEANGFEDANYEHPHQTVLSRLKVYGILNKLNIYRTDEHGNVIFHTDGDTLTVETQYEYDAAA